MTPTCNMLLALPLCALALPAPAAQSCGAHEAIIAQLAQRYGERRQAVALDGANRMVEVFASEETGSWTLLVTRPDGQSCLLAAGEAFQLSSPLPPGDPEA